MIYNTVAEEVELANMLQEDIFERSNTYDLNFKQINIFR